MRLEAVDCDAARMNGKIGGSLPAARACPPAQRSMPFTVSRARQANDHVRVMEAGFDEHLVKPLRAGKLGPLIEKLVAT